MFPTLNRSGQCVLIISVIGALTACMLVRAPGAQNEDQAQRDALRRAASEAFEGTKAEWDVGEATVEELYTWSMRWMNAELAVRQNRAERIKAAQDHLDRMKELRQRQRVAAGGSDGPLDVAAVTQYYVIEAEILIAETEGTPSP